MIQMASCHSERREESLINWVVSYETADPRCFGELNSPQDESAVADMTNSAGDAREPNG